MEVTVDSDEREAAVVTHQSHVVAHACCMQETRSGIGTPIHQGRIESVVQ